MLDSETWKETLGQTNPLRFIVGFRHRLREGGYCGLHAHQAVEIVYHPSGRGSTRLANRHQEFEGGSAVVYAPAEEHDQRMGKSGEDLCIHIAVPERMRKRLCAGFYVPHVTQQWVIRDIQFLCLSHSVLSEFERRILDLRATAVLLALVNLACSASEESRATGVEEKVRRAENFINEHFSTIESLQDVARHLGISHDHLRHLFKSYRGKSLVRYLNELKVARARELLANSPLPLKQIATMCGFKDEYYFSAVFRKFTAMSPGAYRADAGLRQGEPA